MYLVPTIGGDEEFRTKHKETLRPISATMGSSQAELDKHAIQKGYKEHLERLGLLAPIYETEMRTKQPVFDSFRGGLKVRRYEITPLGRLLLSQIELGEAAAG